MISIGNRSCNICDQPGTLRDASEIVEVNSNVRRFAQQRFTVWRCNNCRSLNSRDNIDLAPYYQHYPMQQQKPDLAWRLITGNYVRRLQKAGLQRNYSLLDFGCGSGRLVDELHLRGYRRREFNRDCDRRPLF